MDLHEEGVFRVMIKEGTHLASSTTEAGMNVGSLLNNVTNTPDGLAILERIDIDDLIDAKGDGTIDPKTLVGMAIGAAIVLAGVAVYHHRSRIRTWWDDRLVPVVAARLGITRSSRVKSDDEIAAVPATEISAVAFSAEISEAIKDTRPAMSSVEARQRLVIALLAAAVSAEELRLLRSHRILDADDLRELYASMRQLSREEVLSVINQSLASGEIDLDDRNQDMLVKLLGGGSFANGKYVPITSERVLEVIDIGTYEPEHADSAAEAEDADSSTD